MLPCVLEMLEQLASHDLEAAKVLDIERRRQGVIPVWASSKKGTSIRSMAWHFMNQQPSLKKVVRTDFSVGEECVQFEGTACTWFLMGHAIAWWSGDSIVISPGWRAEDNNPDSCTFSRAMSILDMLLPLVIRRLNRIPGLHLYESYAFYAFQEQEDTRICTEPHTEEPEKDTLHVYEYEKHGVFFTRKGEVPYSPFVRSMLPPLHLWGKYVRHQPFQRRGVTIPKDELVVESRNRGLYLLDW
jgi:hypothetical protein